MSSPSQVIRSGVEKLQESFDGSLEGKKIQQLAANTKDVHDPKNRITTDYGVTQSNTDTWLRVGTEDTTGPLLLEDHASREKIHRFDHGAFGTFKMHKSLEAYTTAGVLTDTSRSTPLFQRFSTVLGSRGSADTVRDVRGFALKFYTDEGNWDIVGNNIPVFFIQDALKFPDVIHAGKPEPHNEVPQAQSAHNNFWDFQYLHTEATHMFMWQQSDRTIPRSYRMMEGFGVNTFKLVNKNGEAFLTKFHFRPHLGVHSFVWDEALKLAGQDPDFHRKDLEEAITSGCFPKWDFGVQLVPEGDEDKFEFDLLDATKLWPEEEVPIQFVGEYELNRNVDEYFTQVEQVAFCTGHLVPGIHHSDDPLLQGRSFSYSDTQLSRIGINFQELPINKPVCPVMSHNRDGQSRHTITKGTVNYWPNRFESAPPAKPEEGPHVYVDYAAKAAGMKTRLASKKFKEHYNQAQLFYNSMSPPEKAHIAAALSFELDHCDDPVVYNRMCERLTDIDLELAQNVAELVGAPIPQKANRPNHGKTAKNLSQTQIQPKEPTIETRRVAIIIADGFDRVSYDGIVTALKAAKAIPYTIAPKRSPIFAAGESKDSGKGVKPDHNLEGMRSTMFDSIFVPGGADSIATLRKSGRALHWVREAYAHLKAIGATGEAVELIKDACALPGMDFSTSGEVINSYGVVTAAKVMPESFKETIKMAKGAKDFVDAYTFEISQHKNFEREMNGFPMMIAF
ncbi:catalase A [Meristemomyces frigidus]|nr:catalase A [Meristemomyces frigidus]